MKIIITGADDLGQLLAERLCEKSHNVTIIDSSGQDFERLKEKLDLMIVEGKASDAAVLRDAGIEHADILLAVSNDEAVNIIACRLAEHFGVKRTICRLYSADFFSEKNKISPDLFGIWRAFSPYAECVRKIVDVLENPILLEKIQFSNPDALMQLIAIDVSSPLSGIRIKDIPGNDRLSSIRFAAIIRDSEFIVPHGDTIIVPGDKLYIAGHRDQVNQFVQWVSGQENGSAARIVIAGAEGLGKLLAKRLLEKGYDVRVIEKNRRLGEQLLDELPPGFIVINGDPTDEEVLEEAGVSGCQAYVGTEEDDENNILSCIIAKRMGAAKVVTITRKPEYIRIVPAMEMIDCGFSSTLISVNTIFRLMESGTVRIDAKLQRYHAYLTEFKITERSPLCGKALMDCKLPSSAVFAMLFRFSNVFSPSGSTVFQAGDTIAAIVTPETAKALGPLFPG